MKTKTCFTCGASKPVDDFYRHAAMADGRLGKCKACTKSDVGEHRLQNLERIRAYDRDRGKDPERAKKAAKVSYAWLCADPRRMACHNAVARAVRAGKLPKQPCERCGKEKAFAHHENYDRKLDVTWLCQPCHKQRHKEMVIEGIEP